MLWNLLLFSAHFGYFSVIQCSQLFQLEIYQNVSFTEISSLHIFAHTIFHFSSSLAPIETWNINDMTSKHISNQVVILLERRVRLTTEATWSCNFQTFYYIKFEFQFRFFESLETLSINASELQFKRFSRRQNGSNIVFVSFLVLLIASLILSFNLTSFIERSTWWSTRQRVRSAIGCCLFADVAKWTPAATAASTARKMRETKQITNKTDRRVSRIEIGKSWDWICTEVNTRKMKMKLCVQKCTHNIATTVKSIRRRCRQDRKYFLNSLECSAICNHSMFVYVHGKIMFLQTSDDLDLIYLLLNELGQQHMKRVQYHWNWVWDSCDDVFGGGRWSWYVLSMLEGVANGSISIQLSQNSLDIW